MTKRYSFQEAEIIPPEDLTAIGETGLENLDRLSAELGGFPSHHSGYAIGADAADPNSVIVTGGSYWKEGRLYGALQSETVDLVTYRPTIATDERWIALVLRSTEETINQTRFFETGEEPLTASVPVAQSTPKEVRRVATIVVQQGLIGPPPQNKPGIAETDAAIAFVRLTTSGVQDIEVGEGDRVTTVFELAGKMAAVEVTLEQQGEAVQTLRTDLLALSEFTESLTPKEFSEQLARDTARTRQLLHFPDEARNYRFYPGLVLTELADHVDTQARLDTGFRHPFIASNTTPLRLADPADPKVARFDDGSILPVYDEVVRFSTPIGRQGQNISDTEHVTRVARTGTESHERTTYGPPVKVCENEANWSAVGKVRAGQTFKANGETWVSGGPTSISWNDRPEAQNHKQYTAKKVIRTSYTSHYTYYDTKTEGISGALYFQTFAASSSMWMTGFDLHFRKVGGSGGVTVHLCFLGKDGLPNLDAGIATARLDHADLATGWVRFPFDAVLLEQGQRYAFVTETSGNHEVSRTESADVYQQGITGRVINDNWAETQSLPDFTFRIVSARFRQERTVVQMQSASLAGGISQLDMIYRAQIPDGTRLEWEARQAGSSEWQTISVGEGTVLDSIPLLVDVRAIFIGTRDLQALLQFDEFARITVARLAETMQAVLEAQNFGYATNTVTLFAAIDGWDEAKHTATLYLYDSAGNEVVADTQSTPQVDPQRPTRVLIRGDWALAADVAAVQARIDLTTTDASDPAFVQDAQIVAF